MLMFFKVVVFTLDLNPLVKLVLFVSNHQVSSVMYSSFNIVLLTHGNLTICTELMFFFFS